mmetsp:Transcript_38354/g.105655  ORF Transcript_38354/g.105655 Transcript_38354/m.105655 type:complete len:190 (-) Transcript_38354:114-683(-)
MARRNAVPRRCYRLAAAMVLCATLAMATRSAALRLGLAGPATGTSATFMVGLRRLGRIESRVARRYTSVASDEAAGLLETGEWAYLDVRRPDEQQALGIPAVPEYGAGLHTVTSHVPGPGGMSFDPAAWLAKVEAELPDKNQKVIVGCAAGIRSKMAAQVLEDSGYTEVLELDDGFMGWRARGLPVAAP